MLESFLSSVPLQPRHNGIGNKHCVTVEYSRRNGIQLAAKKPATASKNKPHPTKLRSRVEGIGAATGHKGPYFPVKPGECGFAAGSNFACASANCVSEALNGRKFRRGLSRRSLK